MNAHPRLAAKPRNNPLWLAAALGLLFALALAVPPAQAGPPPASPGCFWTRYFSEERQAMEYCPSGAIHRIHCIGGFCDEMAMECCAQPSVQRSNDYYLSPIFDGKGPIEFHFCRDGRYVRGIECFEGYCGRLMIHCEAPGTVDPTTCKETGYFSEENGGVGACGPGTVVTGVVCHNRNCDNLRLQCCRVR